MWMWNKKIPSREFTNSFGMEFVPIPAGSFEMGAEQPDDEMSEALPRHRVTISQPFYLGKYEVTQEQWEAVMGENPSKFRNPAHPVENVSYVDAQVFIQRLNELEGTRQYRLPSEAEWEYAARAGTTAAYGSSDEVEALRACAWYDDGERPSLDDLDDLDPDTPMAIGEFLEMYEGHLSTQPVGQKEPNPWGLYDMLGNVEEWVEDWYAEDYYARSPEIDPTGPPSGVCRVSRGGSYGLMDKFARPATRRNAWPVRRSPETGFRVAFSEKDGRKLLKNPPRPRTAEKEAEIPFRKRLPWILSAVVLEFAGFNRLMTDKKVIGNVELMADKGLIGTVAVIAGFVVAFIASRKLSGLRRWAAQLAIISMATAALMLSNGEPEWYAGLFMSGVFGGYALKGNGRGYDFFFKLLFGLFLLIVAVEMAVRGKL